MDERRFELRRNADQEWSVIDRQSGKVAYIDGILFKDIALDVAQAAVKALNDRLAKRATIH